MSSISEAKTNLELMKAIRDRLFDAIRNEDCPPKQFGPIARQFQKNEQDIAEMDGSIDNMRLSRDRLLVIQEILKDRIGDPKCTFEHLSMLTRQLKIIHKEITTLNEQLKDQGGTDNGSTGTRPARSKPWNPETL